MTLLSHLNLSSNKAFPSQQRLANLTGYCRATVNRAIQKLKSLNLISISKVERINGIGLRNQYSITKALISLLKITIKSFTQKPKSKTYKPFNQHSVTSSQSDIIASANKAFDEHYQSITNTKRSDISVVQTLRAAIKRGGV